MGLQAVCPRTYQEDTVLFYRDPFLRLWVLEDVINKIVSPSKELMKGQGKELVMTTRGFCGHGFEEVLHVFSINEILKVSHSWARQCTSVSKASPHKIQRSLASPSIASSWVCLNTDSSVKNEEGFAAAGGLVCDHNGGWTIEFCRYLGSCTMTEVELWGILDGLKLILDRRFERVSIQTVNLEAVNAI
ncbi:hypothetical protein Gotri_023161 [Gossypium trilobum]|uniref:RNase H type-1 domain-containing protein n=1 Tax=Gossypium trilobum TaxID=34281 RepID=A0A7J9DIY0_9ROSI|nr:hypothetical protein [Gossypium trilobum]